MNPIGPSVSCCFCSKSAASLPRHPPSQIAGDSRTYHEPKIISIKRTIRLTPAPGCLVVLGTGLDPTLTARRVLALPERRVGLQPIDQEMTGRQRGFTMRRGGGDENDAVARFEPSVAMDDQRGGKRPAPVRLGLDLGQFLFGHAGVVFEGQRRDAFGSPHVPHQPDETRDAADRMVPGGETVKLAADLEIL